MFIDVYIAIFKFFANSRKPVLVKRSELFKHICLAIGRRGYGWRCHKNIRCTVWMFLKICLISSQVHSSAETSVK